MSRVAADTSMTAGEDQYNDARSEVYEGEDTQHVDEPINDDAGYEEQEEDEEQHDASAEPKPKRHRQQSAATIAQDFPDELWAIMVNDVKLRAPDEVILEICTALQQKGLGYPELLEHAPSALLTQIFPLDTHAQHHVGVLHVQAELRRRTEAKNNVQARAMHRLANAQEKTRKDKKGSKRDFTDSEGEDESTRKKSNATQSMKVYKMESIPHEHMPDFDSQNAYAKRAMVGFKERGDYVVPGSVTSFCPQWMKQHPKQLDDVTTHAQWVAAYWGKALTQIACQGHAGQQTLSLPEMLTEFLNTNKAIAENSTRVGWWADDAKWAEATERLRRMDSSFNVHTHFETFTDNEVSKTAKTAEAAKPKGKGGGKGYKMTQPSSSSSRQPPRHNNYNVPTPPQPAFIPTPTQYSKSQSKGRRTRPQSPGKLAEKGAKGGKKGAKRK